MKDRTFQDVLNYVAVSSALSKRALDELSVHQASQRKASAIQASVLDALVKAGCVTEAQRTGASAMLGSHTETLGLLKLAAEKLASQHAQLVKQATDLGHGVDDKTKTAGIVSSLDDGYVGRKSSGRKESDLAILKVLNAPGS